MNVCYMWIAIFARNFGRSLQTISYIIIHMRHLFWYFEHFSSHPELFLLNVFLNIVCILLTLASIDYLN